MLSKNKLFFDISSEDRIPGGSDSNFWYKLDIPQDRQYDRVVLVGASIPKTYYLIPEGGDIFYLAEDGKQFPMDLPEGNYNRRQFQAVVSDMLNAKSQNFWKYEIKYPGATEADTGKFVFRCTTSAGEPRNPRFVMPAKGSSKLHEQFGFAPGSVNSFVNGRLESANVVKFVTNDSIRIRTNLCSNTGSNVLHTIRTISTQAYSDIEYECPDLEGYSKDVTTSKSNIYQFSITDSIGRTLNFHGLPVHLTICVYSSDTTFELIKHAIGLYSTQHGSPALD